MMYTKCLKVFFILQKHQRAQGGLALFFFNQEARDSLLGKETFAYELEKERRFSTLSLAGAS